MAAKPGLSWTGRGSNSSQDRARPRWQSARLTWKKLRPVSCWNLLGHRNFRLGRKARAHEFKPTWSWRFRGLAPMSPRIELPRPCVSSVAAAPRRWSVYRGGAKESYRRSGDDSIGRRHGWTPPQRASGEGAGKRAGRECAAGFEPVAVRAGPPRWARGGLPSYHADEFPNSLSYETRVPPQSGGQSDKRLSYGCNGRRGWLW